MKNESQKLPEFTGWRKLIWPIYKHELKKFLPMGIIMFGILFNYTLLRDTKDTLVVTAAGSSVITFLKLFCVTPAAVLFVLFYAKLTSILSREKVFYVVVTPFLVFFGAFAFILYPNIEFLHPSAALVESLHAQYPKLGGFINIWANWTFSLFYILAEIWGSAMIALMFWQFANQIVRLRESKRFYGLFVVIGNLSLIFSGQAVKFCSQGIKVYFPEDYVWQVSLYLLMSLVVAMGIMVMWVYRWMHKAVLTDPLYYDESEMMKNPNKKKKQLGLVESFKIIIKSPELGLIATLIIAYGITINLVEVQWKEQLKFYFEGDKGAYNGFMGDFSTVTGILAIVFGWFIGSNILRILSWFKAAIITPMAILIGGATFYCFILSNKISFLSGSVEGILSSIGTNPLTAATFLGAGIIIVAKVIKYTLFDPTKEMAYIPLDEELKTKGKAAVDVIGGRAGKAGGSLVQSGIFILFETTEVLFVAPFTFVVFLAISACWLLAVKLLSRRVNEGMDRKNNEILKEAPAAA